MVKTTYIPIKIIDWCIFRFGDVNNGNIFTEVSLMVISNENLFLWRSHVSVNLLDHSLRFKELRLFDKCRTVRVLNPNAQAPTWTQGLKLRSSNDVFFFAYAFISVIYSYFSAHQRTTPKTRDNTL